MADKQEQILERIARQELIDQEYIAPVWEQNVDIPLLELCCANNTSSHPVILMPELRFRSLLTKMIECMPGTGKIMIVDNTNSRFEALRKCAQNCRLNLYFSTQEVSALNYADNIFHIALTEVGLATAVRAEVVFSAYRRVLKPGGHLICSMPLFGSFPAFFDIMDECLFRLYPAQSAEIMQELMHCIQFDTCREAITNSGLVLKSDDVAEFDLSLPNAEQLLFATLIESHFLGYCMSIADPDLDSKALLTQIVRSFHHYFEGESLKVPMKIGIFTAIKPE